ncbi:Hypothetical predicted protein [Paramuricea clavata]|uniref:Uncharacterized protein n=1 Tax=Paramuricea clavata TaxID=317549 RepID=A0A6S7IUU6_PARCT|nr:Hypothetical predicted protein [Paramuricea clavata]
MDSSFKEQLLQDNRKAQNSQFSIAGSSDDALKGQLNQFNHVKNNDMDSSFKEQPVQDNINAQNNQFNMAGSSEDNLKAQNSQFNKEEPLEDNLNGQMNQFNHIKDDMDNTNQALQDTTKAQSHQFNHSKVNDMDKPIDDHTTAQTSQLNHHPPTNDTSSSNTEESKAPSIINHQMLHPWATQHSRHHYRDQDFTENQKYLTGKVMKTHQQQNWDKWGHYDDDMDLMRSDMTSWNDQGLEAGSKDISGSYNDPYGDMMGDYKEPYGSNGTSRGYGESYEDNKDGNYMDNEGVDKGMDGTYGETNNYDTDMTSMYKGTDSKAYPKQPEDNIGSMDTTLVVHSQDSRGKQRINGLSFEGGVGMSLQQYADEIGQVRGLHHMPSEKKEDNLKIKRKKKSKH